MCDPKHSKAANPSKSAKAVALQTGPQSVGNRKQRAHIGLAFVQCPDQSTSNNAPRGKRIPRPMRTSSARLLQKIISPATSLYQSTAPKQARTRHACQSAAWRGRGSSCCRRDQRGARAMRSVDRDRSAAAFCFWSSLDESSRIHPRHHDMVRPRSQSIKIGRGISAKQGCGGRL